MDAGRLILLALAAALAGAINAVAGGGSLISFPAALAAGLPPVVAKATNTVALVPGSLAATWAYRGELSGHARLALGLTVPGLGGAVLGAAILVGAPPRAFELLIPALALGATLLLAAKDALWRSAKASAAPPSATRVVMVGAGLFAASVYGGYFGAGLGILALSLLMMVKPLGIHELNAMKSLIVGGINGAAAIYFFIRGVVDLPAALAMLVGSVLGGFASATLARRASPRVIRRLVVAVGVVVSVALAARYWGRAG
ncbi:MAG: sulfite exporter TauE/SafE family protein [Sorangiineae bacterium]|nr:sulfite exporter TauE/SafE family protein [Polyangiaceae bacterium]MEB2324086.1 sulfite exporter TauE/SafE family protein [Sorangiineae bacterium]